MASSLIGLMSGIPMPGAISGYGGGTFNIDGSPATPVGGLSDLLQQQAVQPLQQQLPQVTPPKPGTFDKGGNGWKILGLIGDALQVTGGGQATYAPAVAHERELETEGRQRLAELLMKQEQARLAREQALADQKTLIDYRAQNPGADMFTRTLQGAGMDLSSPDAKALYRKRAEMLTNPVQLVPDGMGGVTAIRPNSMGGGLPGGYDPNEWEVVEGDAGGNASGGF